VSRKLAERVARMELHCTCAFRERVRTPSCFIYFARVVSVMCEAFPARIAFNPDDSEHGQGVSPDLDFWIGGKFEKSRRWRGRGVVKIRHGDGVK
jgi:hypothetical protein